MVKVAHFITPGGFYGAERWILALMNHLDKSKNILVCPSSANLTIIKEAKKLGIFTRVLKVRGNYAIFDSVKKLLTLLKKEKIDILHTHGYKSDIIGYFAARKIGIKIISTPHGWSFNAGLKLKIYEFLDQIFLGFFDLVVPLSNDLKKSLKFVRKSKIKLVNNFIDLDTLPNPKKGNLKLITYIGQLIERKRVQDLVIALKYLDDTIKLQIIGNGPKRKELENLTKKLELSHRVNFLGFRKDRLNLLNKSGIFVLPSLLEGVPRAMMEAIAMGKFVIGTNIPGTIDLIKHKKIGLLVSIKSPKKIATAINWVLKNKKQVEKIVEKGRWLVEKEFSAKTSSDKYKKLYEKMCV